MLRKDCSRTKEKEHNCQAKDCSGQGKQYNTCAEHVICFSQPILSPGKTRKHVARNICYGHMFPRCFPVLPHGKHCFQQQNMFLFHGRNIFCCRKHCFLCGKTGKHRGNMCPQQMFLATCFHHVSSFCQGFRPEI